MEEKHIRNKNSHKRLERIVLSILTVYTLAMFVSAQLSDWSVFTKELIFIPLLAGWFVYIRNSQDHMYRARFISVMAWIDFCIFALHTDHFSSMLATMAGVIVLLGIFCIPQIIYIGLVVPAVVFIYHLFIVKTIEITCAQDVLRVLIQLASVYTVSAVTWIMMHNRRETSEQLIEKIDELEIAERSKDDFMVNISHEIRTPINAVCGMSEAILQEELPISVRRDVIDIQTAGRNLLSTVSNILDFSELETGKMELAEESYNITSTITDIINMALTLDNGKHLELIVDCDADLPSNLVGDEQKLRRIIMNLLENAIKFTKEGGVILRIRSRKEEYGINLIVSIQDSGIGIERNDMEKIFTSFSQVNAKRNREEGGVGLGLAITQALVRSMGGFITVNSTPGTGSEFQFTIPQKVLDETPIVSIKNKKHLFAVCYINMDKYNYSVVRSGYENCIHHIAEQLGILFRTCRSLAELQRRMAHEKYSHIFIGWEEYCEDRRFFEQLAEQITVVLLLDYGQEILVRGSMLRIYKPFTVLSIAAVFNGQKIIQNDEQHISLHNRFIAPQSKVLVVDDNAMNLKVMARLLLPYQIKVTMAGGGREALEKLDHTDFDFVFLDHMMPEMDGVETLHRIRQKPGSYFQSLPVIAFTANAIGGAREMFLSEGFDDFIAKPIELSVLERMLRRYIPVHKQIIVEEETVNNKAAADSQERTETPAAESLQTAEIPASESSASASKGLTQLRQAGINIDQALSYCGDQEGFREIITIYHTEGPKRSRQLEQCFKEQDWKNYVISVHALKSNSKGIGANDLAGLAQSLELAGKENRIDYILEHHEELLEQHDLLLQILDNNAFIYPEKIPPHPVPQQKTGINEDSEQNQALKEPAPAEASGQTLADLTARLKEKLESFESEGLEEILEQLSGFRYQDIPLAELADEIRNKTNDFDFLGASEILGTWEERLSDNDMAEKERQVD